MGVEGVFHLKMVTLDFISQNYLIIFGLGACSMANSADVSVFQDTVI